MSAMWLLRISALGLLIGCAQADDRVIASNAPDDLIGEIGVVGAPDYSPGAAYKITIRPTRLASGALYIPDNYQQAARELQAALPSTYLADLRLRDVELDDGSKTTVCLSNSEEIDWLVDRWMISAWKLNRLPARSEFISRATHPSAIAQIVRDEVCRNIGEM